MIGDPEPPWGVRRERPPGGPRDARPLVVGLLVIAAALLTSAGCSSSDPPAPEPAERSAGADSELLEIPHPDLSALEPSVQEQLARARERHETSRQQSAIPPERLGPAFGELGMLYHAYRLLDAAEPCYLNARRVDPAADARWSHLLGHLYRQAGRLDEAADAFRRVIESRPDDLAAVVQLAEVELEQNRLERAEPLFRRGLELDARCVPCLFGLGKIAAGREELTAAVELYEAALGIAPQATEIHYPLGLAYRGLGQRDRAANHLDRRGTAHAGVEDPLLAELAGLTAGWRLPQNRGALLFREGLYDQALVEFRKAVEAAPDEPLPRVNLASTLTRLGQEEAAERELEQALRLDPSHALAHFNLGTLSARRGDDERAIRHYRAALAAEPNRLDARFNLANALRRVGRLEESIEHYRAVVEADPRSAAARLGEALTLAGLGRYRDSAARLEQASRVLPDDRQVRSALVRILAAAPDDGLRDGPRALSLGRALLDQDPSLPIIVGFAMAAAETGDFRLAADWQARAVQAVSRAERADLLAALEAILEGYRRGEPCRTPFPEGG